MIVMGVELENESNVSANLPESPKRLAETFNRNTKRKFEVEVHVAPPSGDIPDSSGLRKSQTTFESHNRERNFKKLRVVANERELQVLQIQRAMISDEDGDRQIHVAVAREDLEVVKKLCPLMKKAGIKIDITNFLRQTALHLAVIVGNTAILQILLDNGASVLLRDRNGNSAIHLVMHNFSEDVFRLLLSHPHAKSIIDSADYEGYTALHHATIRSNAAAVSCLYSFGADMNAVDGKSGRSSLIHAVLAEDKEMVQQLLKYGACVDKVDYSGQCALDFALHTTNKELIKILEKSSSFKLSSLKHNTVSLTLTEQKALPINVAHCTVKDKGRAENHTRARRNCVSVRTVAPRSCNQAKKR